MKIKSLFFTMLVLMVTSIGVQAQAVFSEDFESGSMPNGWTQNGDGTWEVGTGDNNSEAYIGAHTGTYNALIRHGDNGDVTMLISPMLNLTTLNVPQLSFWYVNRDYFGDNDELRVYYRTTATGEWQQVLAITDAHEVWTEATVTIPQTAVQVAFKMTDNWGFGVGIDDIAIEEGPSCAPVSNLTATSNTNSVTLTWSHVGNSGVTYTVYSADGSVVATNITGTSYTVNGLNPATSYTFGVQAKCSATDVSSTVLVNTQTLLLVADVPYSTSFESGSDVAWLFANSANGWCIGNAVSNGGSKALYISNDGGVSNAYSLNSTSASYAYKSFNLTTATYTISFDWKAYGESNYDYLRVFAVPASVPLTAGATNSIGTSNTPSGWISLDGGGKLNLSTDWQTVQNTFTPTTSGVYNIVFYWCNDDLMGTQPPAAIDNVVLQTNCSPIIPFTETFNGISSGIPACWDNSEGTTTNESYKWNYCADGYEGGCLRFTCSGNNGNTNVLTTPTITISGDARFKISYKNPSSNGNSLVVKASINGGYRRTLMSDCSYNGTSWVTSSVNLDHVTYTGKDVTFYIEATSGGTGTIDIDNVIVEPLSVCNVGIPFVDEMSNTNTDCWRLVRYNLSNSLRFTTYDGHSVLAFNSSVGGASGADYTQIAYSPLFDASNTTSLLRVSVVHSTYGSSDPLYLGYSTSFSEDPDDYIWSGPFYTNGYSDWSTYETDIPSTAVQIAIKYSPSGRQHQAYVDRVEVGEVLSCNTPRPIPYTENFEGVTGASYIASGDENQPMPDCWDVSTTYVSANMIYKPHVMSGNLQNSGVNSLALFQYGNTAVYAVLPLMAMPLNQLHLSFWMGTAMSSGHPIDGTLTVGYVTNDSYTSFTAIQSYHVTTSVNTMYTVPLDEASYNIPSTASRLALKWESSESTFCYIDDITLEDAAGVPCEGKELPYSYDFEYGNNEYANWTVINMSSGVNQAARMTWNNCASYFHFSSQNEDPNGVYDQYLISPELCTPSGVDLEFQYRIGAAPSGETFVVGYSTTTSQPSSFIWGNTVTVNKGMAWSTYRQSFPEGTRYIAVHYTSQHRVGLFVDNFAFNNPACPAVNNLKAGVANNSVTLKWDASTANGATYTIYNMSTGAVLASGITNTSYTVNNLAARTSYTFGVKSQCSASTSSTIATVNAVTTCASEAMPFTENFNNLTVWGDLPACWDVNEYNGAIDFCSNASHTWEVYHGHSGLGLTYSSFSNNGYSNTLATPPVTINENAQLVFWYKNPTNGDFTVLASPDGGITRYVLASGLSSQWWTQKTIALNPAIFNGHNVIIYFQGTEGGTNDDFNSDICLDEVSIEAGNGVVCTRTIPYIEDFEEYEAVHYLGSTDLDNNPQPVPTCWDVTTNSDVDLNPASEAYNMTFYYRPHVMTSVGGNMCNSRWQSGYKSLCMASAEHSATYALLPPMDSALNHLKLSFWMGTDDLTQYPDTGTLIVGYVTSDDPSSFTAIQAYPASSLTNAYSSMTPTLSCTGGQTYTLDLASLPATARRLAFKWDNPSSWHPLCFIDDIRLTKGFYYQVTVCDDYAWNGTIYNATGLYYANNDTLDLTVIGTNTSETTVCTTESSYTWHGMTYISSGEYTFYAYNNETGCDDVEILHLTISGDCCPPVENLMVTDTGVSSVSLAWEDTHNTGATYLIAYRMEGSYDTVYVDAISSSSYTVNGLAYGTTYEFFVSVVCSADANSTLVSVYGTTASCRIESLPYTQDFESGIAHDVNADASTTPFIDCMTRLHALGFARPAIVESATWSHSGTQCLNWMCYFEDYQIVALPELNTTTYPVNTLSLSFWYRMVATNQAVPTFEIGVMTDPTNASTFVPVTNVTIGDFMVGLWYQANVSLAGYNGTGKFVAIRTTGIAGDQSASVLVDDITLEERVCLPVTSLTIDNTSTTTVSLSWNGSAPSYTVMNGTTQVATGITDTHYTVTGLTAATHYTFSVIANCSATESSTESMINVNTDCGVESIPYFEGFEGYDAVDYFGSVDLNWLPQPLPLCWEGTITTDVNNDTTHTDGFGMTFSYKPHVVAGAGSVFWNGGSQSLEMVAASNSSTYALLPQMNTPLNQLQMEFWMGTNYYATTKGILTVGYVTNDSVNTFTAIQGFPASVTTQVSYSPSPGGKNVTVNLSDVPDNATRLAFKWENTVDNTTAMLEHPLCFIDDINIAVIDNCSDITIPYIENFEADGFYNCWTVHANSEYTHCWDIPSMPLNGASCFVFGNSSNPPQYLISPELMGTGTGLQMSFSYKALMSNFHESFMVGYSTTTNDTAAFVWSTEVTDITSMTYDRYVKNMNASGIKYVAVKYTARDMSALLIDSLVIREIPVCSPVTNLAVDSVGTNTVSLSWNGTAASYTLMNGSAVVATNITGNHYTVSGLTTATHYIFSLIANCSATESSEPVHVSATTDCEAITRLPYMQNFDLDVHCWTLIDADGDGYNWRLMNGAVHSASYDNNAGPLHPDNWLVTPRFVLPADGNYEVSWSAAPQDLLWPSEHYGLYVSTTGNADTADFTLLQEWTLTASDNPAIPVVDLSAYAGQSIYLAFRHWNCFDWYRIAIDDFIIREQAGANQVVITVTRNNPMYGNVTGGGTYNIGDNVTVTATPATGYQFQKWVNLDNQEMSTANPYSFVATTDTTLQAIFIYTAANSVEVIVLPNNPAMGSATGGGSYLPGSVVTLTATANPGYHFVNWEIYGNALSTTTPFNMTITDEIDTIYAIFEADICHSVSDLDIDSISETTISLSWNGSAESYRIYNLANSSIVATVTETHYTVTGLASGTSYTFGVRAFCSVSDSSLLSVITMNTSCAPVTTLPYIQRFDTYPTCWTLFDMDGDLNVWTWDNGIMTSASYGNNIALTPDNWLISPQLNLPADNNYEVTWDAAPVDITYPSEHYGLYVSTTGNADPADFALLQEWTLTANDNPATPVIDLSAYAGQSIYLAFRHWNCTNMFSIAIDNFIVREQVVQPDCNPVTNLVCTDTTETSIAIQWEDPDNSGVTYRVGYIGLNGYGAIDSNITTTSYVITGLTPNTTYIIAVQPDCADSIENSAIIEVTTLQQTSIASVDVKLECSLYPNPANTVVTVKAEGMRRVAIYDATGREVENREVNGDMERFDVTGLDNGVYFFRIETAVHMAVRKCVISH